MDRALTLLQDRIIDTPTLPSLMCVCSLRSRLCLISFVERRMECGYTVTGSPWPLPFHRLPNCAAHSRPSCLRVLPLHPLLDLLQ
jgi:hypothetical protein